MRILIIHNYYQHRGGEDFVVEQEIKALSKNNIVKLISSQNKKGWKGLLSFLFYPFNFYRTDLISQEISDFKPDVVHVHNVHYSIGPWLIRKIKSMGYPLVMTLHNFRLICPSATLFYNGKLHQESIKEDFPWTAVKAKALDNSLLKTFLTAFTYWIHKKWLTWKAVDKYFVFSQFSKDIFQSSSMQLNDQQLVIKPNFGHPVELNDTTRSNDFIYIGRLSEEKGIIPLLNAIAQTNHTIKVFGTGPQQDIVEVLSKQHTNINYKGYQDKTLLNDELLSTTALIVPSICYEGMPMTIIEAYASGTPVLSSNIGILSQMVVPLTTGMHFDPYDTESIISCLDSWKSLTNEEKHIYSQNCKNEFELHYEMERNIALIEATYQEAIKKTT